MGNKDKKKQTQQRGVTAKTAGKAVREKPSTSAAGSKERKDRHTSPLPALGQPGGLDDPNRKGLSGAGVKWYLRFLKQGLTPEEARAKVEKQRQERKEASTSGAGGTSQGKRGSEHISPAQAPQHKKRKMKPSTYTSGAAGTAGQATSYATAAKISKMGILPEEYPQVMLDAAQMSALEEALVEAMMGSTVRGLQFAGIHFRQGMVLVDCENEETVNWLDQVVCSLPSWKGPKLVAKKGEDLPKPHVVTVFLPRSKGQEAGKLLKLIGNQNPDLQTDLWKVMNVKEEGHGQVLTFGIDPKSREAILAKGCSIHYRFGRVPVSGLKKTQEKPETTEVTSESSDTLVEQREPSEKASPASRSTLDDINLDDIRLESDSETEGRPPPMDPQEFVELEALVPPSDQ